MHVYIYIFFYTKTAINVFLHIMSVYLFTTGPQCKLVNVTHCANLYKERRLLLLLLKDDRYLTYVISYVKLSPPPKKKIKNQTNKTLECMHIFCDSDLCIIIFYLISHYFSLSNQFDLSRLESSPRMRKVGCSNPSREKNPSRKIGSVCSTAKRSAIGVCVTCHRR